MTFESTTLCKCDVDLYTKKNKLWSILFEKILVTQIVNDISWIFQIISRVILIYAVVSFCVIGVNIQYGVYVVK